MIQLLGIIVFALLLYLGQKYVYAKIWQRDLKVSLSFREDGIWEGQESELSEIIENRKRLPLTMLKVKFQTDRHLVFADTKGSRTTDRYYRNDIFQIGRLEKVTRALHFTGGRRGYYTIQEADLVASDLFLTAQYTATTPIEHCSLYVYPKPFSHPDFKRSLKQLNGEVLAKRHLLEDPFEYRGIRDYQPQDDLKSINWKATARTGDLKVNQKNYTSQKSVRIFVNLEDTGILQKAAEEMMAGPHMRRNILPVKRSLFFISLFSLPFLSFNGQDIRKSCDLKYFHDCPAHIAYRHGSLPVHLLLGRQNHPQAGGRQVCQAFHIKHQSVHTL